MAMMAFPFSAAFPKPMPAPTATAVLLHPKLTHPVPSQPKSFPGAGIIRPRVVVRASSGDRQDVGEIEHPKTASEEPKSEEASNDMGSEVTRKGLKEGGGDLWWGGVTEEIGEIEWPAFGKVVGTTGVVLGVIAGSSVVLLTVNAVLAELSDRVFAGRGIQDFFG